jgi:hypothetical protein
MWYAVLILLENLRTILAGAISNFQVERVPGSLSLVIYAKVENSSFSIDHRDPS